MENECQFKRLEVTIHSLRQINASLSAENICFQDSNSVSQRSIKHPFYLSYTTLTTVQPKLFLTAHLRILCCKFNTFNDLKYEKFVNCKVIDLVGYCNFDVDFVSIQHC